MGPSAPPRSAAPRATVAPVAVPDHHGGAAVDDAEEVVDVPVERGVEGERPREPVVAAAVVDDGVQVAEAAEDPGETGGAVERPVDQDDDGDGRAMGPRGRAR